MRLVPVTGSLAAVAKLEKSSVSAARTLVQLALFESLSDQIEEHRDTMESVMLANMEQVAKAGRVHLLREHVGRVISGQDEPDDLEAATDLAIMGEYVEKGLLGRLTGYERQDFERKHPRDRSGRFMTVDVATGDPNLMHVSSRQKTAKDAAIIQATQWKNGGLIDDDTPLQAIFSRVTTDDKGKQSVGTPMNDPKRNPRVTLAQMRAAQDDAIDEIHGQGDALLTQLALHRGDVKTTGGAQRGAMDVMGAVMGNDRAAQRLLRGLDMFDGNGQPRSLDRVAANMYGLSGQVEGKGPTDRQAYRRMAITGQALQRATLPGSTGHVAGQVAQLMGEFGPEAEKVLGPGIRRTAYRYRGTERRPDRQVVTQVAEADDAAGQLSALKPGESVNLGEMAPQVQDIARMYTSRRLSTDQRTLGMRGDAAVAYMLGVGQGMGASHLPSRELTELSLESGEVPPSEGILIDEHGRVMAQAVGYNGDHYLPFDLRNLGHLFGGQYVRTRANGGLSSEDIYTGLVTGARQLQVVSNSGVFTIEFDPELRGARRYNDKVKRMVSRYEEMLDAIATGGLYEADLTGEQKAELRARAAEGADTEEDFKARYEYFERQARLKGRMVDADENELAEGAEHAAQTAVRDAANRAQGPMSRATLGDIAEDARRKFYDKHRGPSVRQLKLDGPGYDRAMKALKQEFPYYIRQASWQSLPQWLAERNFPNEAGYRQRAGSDVGRVTPGQTNARVGAKAGMGALAQAKANRRMVPTGGAAPRPATSTVTSTTTAPSAPGAPKVPGTPGAQAKSRDTLIKEMKESGSDYQDDVYEAARHSAFFYSTEDPANGEPLPAKTPEAWRTKSPADFTWLKLRSATSPQKFTDWLVNAEPWEQDKVLESEADVLETLHDNERAGFTPDSVRAGYAELRALVALTRDPFGKDATPDATDNKDLTAKISEDPRPWRFPDIDLDNPPSDDPDKQLDERVKEHLIDFKKIGDEQVPAAINRLVGDYNRQREGTPQREEMRKHVIAAHRARSILAANAHAKALARYGGGAGPKAPEPVEAKKSDARPRRQLLFHDLEGASVVKSRSVSQSSKRLAPAGRR